MALCIQNLSFSYPEREKKILDGVSLTLGDGEFALLAGKSGCGKTTLFNLIVPALMPEGKRSGTIQWNGIPISHTASPRIGMVRQDPETGIVTEKVWHELAFGLENLGVPEDQIRRKVAEAADFFGIGNWFDRDTDSLSGGQKQLLNLAAVMATDPELLLLDEPTAQLDPISAKEFLSMLDRLHRELGTTILLADHRTEELFPLCDKIFTLQDNKIAFSAPPRAALACFMQSGLDAYLPCAPRLAARLGEQHDFPLTIPEGRAYLRKFFSALPENELPPEAEGEVLLSISDASFCYERGGKPILNHASLSLRRGEILFLLGGNGAGKTTFLRILAGFLPLQGGKIRYTNKQKAKNCRETVAFLPQNTLSFFRYDSVEKELASAGADAARREEIIRRFGLAELLNAHPFDLSGGERQRAALACLVLEDRELFLLDEPTKGLDPEAKKEISMLFRDMKKEGKTLLVVSHDLEFAAACADRCALFFHGEILEPVPPRLFFSGNRFYTTAAARLAHDLCPGAISEDALFARLERRKE